MGSACACVREHDGKLNENQNGFDFGCPVVHVLCVRLFGCWFDLMASNNRKSMVNNLRIVCMNRNFGYYSGLLVCNFHAFVDTNFPVNVYWFGVLEFGAWFCGQELFRIYFVFFFFFRKQGQTKPFSWEISQFLIQLFLLFLGEGYAGCSSFARLSLQPKQPRVSLTSDEAPTEFRRKSAGSPNPSHSLSINNNNNEPYIYAFDECERHADGSVVLR